MFSEKFIAATREYCTFEMHVPAPYMRKTFQLEKLPEKCSLTICGLGCYRLFVNGQEITCSFLAPYVSNPDHVIYYNAYDLRKYVKLGRNVIAVLLGNGFLNNIGGFIWKFDEASFRSAPKMAFVLDIDGQITEADECVKVHPSPVTFDDMRAGERYDARLEIADWTQPDYDDSGWANALFAEPPKGEKRLGITMSDTKENICRTDKKEACGETCVVEKKDEANHGIYDAVRITEERKTIAIIKGDGGYIYDFGINTAGIARLSVNAFAGQEIKLVFGEVINDGKIDLRNISFEGFTLQDYNQCVIYTCKEGENRYRPSFCYMGYRYAFVSGITEEQATEELLTMLVMHSDLRTVLGFSCSDPVIDQLYRNTMNSTLSNFYFFPMDCPQREKNGWTGDVTLSAEQMLLNFDCEESLREWMFNIRKAQLANGKLPCVVPTTGWGYEWGPGPAWDAALIEMPYRIYQFTGHKEAIFENADAIFKYIQYMQTKREKNGLAAYGLGDWCQVNLDHVEDYTTPLCVSDTLICAEICRKAAVLYRAVGDREREAYCSALWKELIACFRRECILEDKTVLGATQTGQAMALYYGAFQENEKAEAFSVLRRLIKEKDDHFDIGVQGNRVLFRVLADFGEYDLAYKLIAQPTFPSFGYHVGLGATSLYESFYRLNERFEIADGRWLDILSQNHHFWGDIAAFFVEYFAGLKINPEVRDIRHIVIAPQPAGNINRMKCQRNMPYGTISLEWRREESRFYLELQAPEGVTGTVVLPDGRKSAIQAGRTEYHCCLS